MRTETYLVGDVILCDMCNEDYTESLKQGGILFGSRGVCPKCAPDIEKSAVECGEQDYIRDRAGPDETFRDFIRRLRGGKPATMSVISFDNSDDFWNFLNSDDNP